MKKILSAILVAVMMIAVLASCATGGSGGSVTTSGTNTTVKLVFKVGEETIYGPNVTVNGDAPVIMDAVKEMIKNKAFKVTISEAGDKVSSVDSYRDCILTVNGSDVSYYWTCTLNGSKKENPKEEPIAEGDEIVFVFTRGYMDANDDYQEGPYDPSTNEYKDPEAETAA